jgi:hypothetical protein
LGNAAGQARSGGCDRCAPRSAQASRDVRGPMHRNRASRDD